LGWRGCSISTLVMTVWLRIWSGVMDVRDIIVSDAAMFRIMRRMMGIWAYDRFIAHRIVVIRFGILQDYVPCVEEAWDVAEAAESDVDDGVG